MKTVTWNRGLTYANRKYDVATLEGSPGFWDGSITKIVENGNTFWKAEAGGGPQIYVQYELAVRYVEGQLRRNAE